MRCFAVAGEGEIREVDIEGTKREVWTVKSEGWDESDDSGLSYLTVNAATLEPGQEGFNLKEWTEKGWIAYWDIKDWIGVGRMGEPHEGGMY